MTYEPKSSFQSPSGGISGMLNECIHVGTKFLSHKFVNLFSIFETLNDFFEITASIKIQHKSSFLRTLSMLLI